MNRPFRLSNAAFAHRAETRFARGFLPRGYLNGLVLSNDTSDATNDVAIAAGVCRSEVNVVHGTPSTLARDQIDMEIPVGIVKQLDVAWAPENYDPEGYSGGGRSGGRSASSLSNTTWHAFVIGGPGLPDDVLFHDSVTQSSVLAALPKDYTAYAWVGSVIRSGGAILAFTQTGNEVRLADPPLDANGVSQTTTAALRALSVPAGVKVLAHINARWTYAPGASESNAGLYVSSPDANDEAHSATAAPLGTLSAHVNLSSGSVLNHAAASRIDEITDTSGRLRFRSSATVTLYVATLGWRYLR